MGKRVLISSYKQLLEYFKETELSSKAICEILEKSIQLLADPEKTREQLINEFEEYVNQYSKGTGEKPIFLGLPSLDVE